MFNRVYLFLIKFNYILLCLILFLIFKLILEICIKNNNFYIKNYKNKYEQRYHLKY
jgi:hypothetical protein